MLKTFFFLLGLHLTYGISAQTAALSISIQDSSFFVAELNGRLYDKPSTVMNFFELNSGNQQVIIYKIMRQGNSELRKSVFEGQIRLESGILTIGYIDHNNQFRILATEVLETKQIRKKRGQPRNVEQHMKRSQFEGVIENLVGIADETERLRAAETVVSANTFCSRQIAEMMLIFENENRRIAIANYAYRFVSDPDRFGEVHHSLRYPSSHRRLVRRIR